MEVEPSSLQNSSLVVECCNGMTLCSSCRWPPCCQALLPHGGSSRNRRYTYRVTWNRSSSKKQTQQEPRIELEPRIKLETPLKRKRVQDDDLRSPVCTPNSSVKVCNGPWDRHIRNHKSSHGLCNKCMWASNRRFWFRQTPLDLSKGRRTWLQARPVNTPDSQLWGWAAGPALGRHANRKLSRCPGARTRHSP